MLVAGEEALCASGGRGRPHHKTEIVDSLVAELTDFHWSNDSK
jgi:hypothetical protein